MARDWLPDDLSLLLTRRRALASAALDLDAHEDDRERIRAIDRALQKVYRGACEESAILGRIRCPSDVIYARIQLLLQAQRAIEESGVYLAERDGICDPLSLMREAKPIAKCPAHSDTAEHHVQDVDLLLWDESDISDEEILHNRPRILD